MSKIQISLDEFHFNRGELNVIFILNGKKYIGDTISEDLLEDYLDVSGKLDSFEDNWDPYSETHYTSDYKLDYSDWKDEVCDDSEIVDFLYYYYKSNDIPGEIEE